MIDFWRLLDCYAAEQARTSSDERYGFAGADRNRIAVMRCYTRSEKGQSESRNPEFIVHLGEAYDFLDEFCEKILHNYRVNTSDTGKGKGVPNTLVDTATIDAVRLLRAQMHPPDISDRPKFRGARIEGIRASEFFEKHYKEHKGTLDSAVLTTHDRKLYDLLKSECHRDGVALADYVLGHREAVQRRREAAAELLGVPSDADGIRKVYSFFSSLQSR